MKNTLPDVRQRLTEHGQEHVLRFWDRLKDGERDALLAQVATLDLRQVERMQRLLGEEQGTAGADFKPASVVELSGARRTEARQRGDAILKAGRAGVLLVAGGQGSRLGFDGPKGAYPVGPLSGDTLFAIHGKKIAAMKKRYGAEIPFYIMTSQANDAATRSFFEEHGFFGLDPRSVMFFVQGMWPALSPEGKIILDRPDHVFMSPDGHGGVLSALHDRGMLADMAERGLEAIFYFQVDNPLVDIADPVFIGAHSGARSEMSIKVCAKRTPDEKLGVVVEQNGRNAIVEYSELTDEQKQAVRPSGELKYKYGSVAIHVFARTFLEQGARADLPLHLAHKKVPYCNDRGETVTPSEPNAYKFEKFIFDALPEAEPSLNLAFDREDEFSPVKNARGEDSPATAQRDMMRKFKRMLEACGVEVPADEQGRPAYRLEIDPAFALDAEALKTKLPEGFTVDGDTLLA